MDGPQGTTRCRRAIGSDDLIRGHLIASRTRCRVPVRGVDERQFYVLIGANDDHPYDQQHRPTVAG